MMSRAPQQQPPKRARKRPATPVYGGQDGSYKNINSDFICPVCFDLIDEAYMTKCGHSFCHECIERSLERNNRCPKCGVPIESPSHIFPNFTLMELIRKHKTDEQKSVLAKQLNTQEWQSLSQDWDLGEINNVMSLLVLRKQQLEQGMKISETRMLKAFLEEVRDRKEKEMEKIKRQLEFLNQDCQSVGETLRDFEQKQLGCPRDHLVPNSSSSILSVAGSSTSNSVAETSGPDRVGGSSSTLVSHITESFAGGPAARPTNEVTEARKKRKVSQHFEDLEKVYLDTRGGLGLGGETDGNLDQFATCLSKFSQYTSIRAVASLNYTHEVFTNSSSIVSSIEFDRDCEFFAIAGVTKKIKVFEYGIVREAVVDLHYPVTEMSCTSKISCIAWNPYKKNMLSSADYDGIVYMWDTSTNQRTQMFQEHEKRCWSVDFNRMDPKMLASGSDDTKVKIWDWDRPQSVMTIEGGANVCCVKFNPTTRYNLAFGSADHCVHYYDLRHPKKAVYVFRGHGKAVSYVKFLNGTDMVSASTDSQLKLWSLGRHNAISTFKGHINEKNFVGLATDGDYIACGSENNSLYLYYKGLSRQILTYKFEPARRLIEKPGKDDDSTEFVSAVTWKADSNILVAANSQGLVKLLELV